MNDILSGTQSATDPGETYRPSQQEAEGLAALARVGIEFNATAPEYAGAAGAFGATRIKGGGKIVQQASNRLKKLGLEGVELAGKSYNSGRKALEAAGFVLDHTTSTGRKAFVSAETGAQVFYDSGKALTRGQKNHWHILDEAGNRLNRSGRIIEPGDIGGHIPAY